MLIKKSTFPLTITARGHYILVCNVLNKEILVFLNVYFEDI